MKGILPLVTIVMIMSSLTVKAGPLVIYGEDDRLEVTQTDKFWQNKARSVAVQIPTHEMGISKILGGKKLNSRTFQDANTSKNDSTGEVITLCDGTRFANQVNPGSCTGFLVAPDLLLTAGHCVSNEQQCLDNDWIFDFQSDENGNVDLDIPAERIYSCKRIIRAQLPSEFGMDFSLIQLDRNTTGRESLEINIADHIGKKDKVLMIGSPLGLPLKISPNGTIRDDDQTSFFTTTLDSFLGNSGSPVFNQRTGKVEGILFAGEEDFVGNMEKMCIEVNRCAENDCRGEDVSRLSSIPELALRETMQIIAKEGRISQLLEINKMDMDFFVDIYSSEKITPLMTALESKQLEVAKLLLEMKADPNHESLNDLRPLEILVSKYHDKEIFKNALDLLMKHNADIHYKNANGENLLFSAVKANNREAVEVLLALGVDPNLKNAQGKTAAEVAKRLGHRSLRNILYYWPRVLSAN